MKKFWRIFFLFILMCALTPLSGCTNRKAVNKGNDLTWDFTNTEPIYLTEWPENKFTSQIIKPENGEIDYIYDDSDSGRYAFFIKDMTEDESAEYIEDLVRDGYSEIASKGTDVTVGKMMQKGNVILNISYSGGIFGIMITMKNQN